MAFSRDRLLQEARSQVKAAFSKKDFSLIQAVRSLDDLDSAKSLLFTRLDEWAKINFPELSFQNEESLCAFVEKFACKEDIDENALEKLFGKDKATQIMGLAKNSFGSPFDEADKKAIRDMASGITKMFDIRKQIERYIENESEKEFKNISFLTDPVLAARLVTQAGGLERLAKMSGSTIQVIGAETALFKHLRSGTLPPKHGVIFQSAYIRGSPYEIRGRVARSLAAKLAIAAKADFFTKRFIAEKLKEDFEKRLQEIKKAPFKEKHEYIPPKPGAFQGGGRGYGGRSSGFAGKSFSSRREGNSYDKPRFEKREDSFPKREGGFERREGTGFPSRDRGFPRRDDRPREGSGEFRSDRGSEGAKPFERRPFKPRFEGGQRREDGFQKREGGFERGPQRPRESGGYKGTERREGGNRESGRPRFDSGGRPPFRKGKPFNKNRR